jgi:hypothetical protein
MRKYVLRVSPGVWWDVVYAIRNLGDNSEVVTCSLEGPEEIYGTKLISNSWKSGVPRSESPEFSVAETEMASPLASTTRAEMRLSETSP